MKTLKSLLMLCAGLSFCACGSDNEPQLPEGTGAVTVKIENPTTRTVAPASTGGVVNGDITLTLEHNYGTSTVILKYNSGTNSYSVGTTTTTDGETAGEITSDEDGSLAYVFYGIGAPSKITAKMYDGKPDASYKDINITTMQQPAASIPVYGEATTFGTGNDITKGNKKYKNYTAAIEMTIPVARLEVNVTVGDMSDFGSVELLGVYLDKVKPTADDAVVNYWLEGDESSTKQATGVAADGSAYAILNDSYFTSPISLTTTTPAMELPLKNDGVKQYFAYNFYAGQNPEFKMLLQVSQKAGQAAIPTYQYAIIKEYKMSGSVVTFENQNIYQVNITLNDDNIQIDEEGADIDYALTATVTKASWTVNTNVTGEWAQ